jgi:hypothetical protein
VAALLAVAGATLLAAAAAAPERKPVAALAPAVPAAADTPFTNICTANAAAAPKPEPAWVSASFENDRCWAPKMPAPVDGYTASREEVVAAMAAAKNYARQAGAYEKCIGDFVASRAGKTMSRSFLLVENHRVLASERNRQTADSRARAAIEAFNEYGSECPG